MRIASLKGIDMAMFYVLSALVFMPSLHPTLSLHLGELDMSDDYDEDEEDYEWDSENDEPRALPVPAEVGHFDHALEGTKFWPMKLGGGDMFNALVTTAMTVRRFGEALEAPSS